MKDVTTISLELKTRNRLKRALIGRETYDDLFERLLKLLGDSN